MKIMTADHRELLEDSLKTEKRITEETFKKLIESGIYEFYGYDPRIKADRYILDDMSNNIGLPVWINKYKE